MDSGDEELKETRQLVLQQNRKKKKSGGFQSMGKIPIGRPPNIYF